MKIFKDRIEAFSDGVIAIIVTIIVLNIPLPTKFDTMSIYDFINSIVVYFVSFLAVGNFWNQHRRLLDRVKQVSEKIVWLNIIFLFFLSLVPLFTKWVIQNPASVAPAVGYGVVFLCVNLSINFMFLMMLPEHLKDFVQHFYLRMIIMTAFILIIIFVAFFHPTVSTVLFIGLPITTFILNLLFDAQPNNRDFHKR